MNIFEKTYLNIIFEWSRAGKQSISDFPKSYQLELNSFEIKESHPNNQDYSRAVTYTIGQPLAYKILDEACFQILLNHKEKIIIKHKKPIKFNAIVKVSSNYFYNFVIGFKNIHSAFLYTTIDITESKYKYLSSQTSRIDSAGDINYIVKLHDF